MFGTDVLVITFIFILLEIAIAVSLFSIYLLKSNKKIGLRIIILTFLYINYNIVSGLMPNESIELPMVLQNILPYGSGVILASYFFFYLTVELKNYGLKLFKVKYLIYSLILMFFLCFGVYYLVYGDVTNTKRIFLVGASIIAFAYCGQTIVNLVKNINKFSRDTIPTKTMIVAGNLSIVFMTTMPILAFFEDAQELNHLLVNISLFLLLYAYYLHIYYQNMKERILLNEFFKGEKFNLEKFLFSINFTKAEVEVTGLMLENKTFKQIGDLLNKSPNTLTSQASSCYKKIGCANKKEFLALLRNME